MEQNKITLLKLTTNPLEVQGIDEVATIWRDDQEGSALIASLSGSPGREEGREFGKRLVLAYNNTYGAAINPEAVPNLKKCLEELLYQFEKVVSPKFTLDHMLIREAHAAIEKAKL